MLSKGLTVFITLPAPSVIEIVSLISLSPLLTMFVPVLIISAGNDTKLPTGNLRKSFIN